MIVKRIKFYQSVKCNSEAGAQKGEYTYIDTEVSPFSVTFADNLFSIVHKETGELTITGLSNVVYFIPVRDNVNIKK